MLKDIETNSCKDIAIAVIHEINPETSAMVWNVYLINYSKHILENVIVSSNGWGMINGEEKQTSKIRHFLHTIEPMSYAKIEPIQEDVFALNNQYWFSAFIDGKMVDHKFIFNAGEINESAVEMVSLIQRKGVVIIS